jgi:hypothetical protein
VMAWLFGLSGDFMSKTDRQWSKIQCVGLYKEGKE